MCSFSGFGANSQASLHPWTLLCLSLCHTSLMSVTMVYVHGLANPEFGVMPELIQAVEEMDWL